MFERLEDCREEMSLNLLFRLHLYFAFLTVVYLFVRVNFLLLFI